MAKLKAIPRELVAQRGPSQVPAPLGLTAAAPRAARALAGTVSNEIAEAQRVAAEAEQRHNARRDAVSRVTAYGNFLESTTAEMRRLDSEEDLSSPASSGKYLEFLSAEKQRILGEHDGSQASKFALAERLELESVSQANELGSLVFQAQQKRMGEGMDRVVRSLAADAAATPDLLNEHFAELDDRLADMAPAMSAAQEESFRTAGRQQILLSAINASLTRGNVTTARNLLAFPGAVEMLSPEQQTQIQRAVGALLRGQAG